MDQTLQDKIKKFLTKRHPEYDEMLPHWQFISETYEGGRQWFKHNIFKYIKEGATEYAERLERGYRFNHTREVVDLVNKYLFKMSISRNLDDAPEPVKAFWRAASRNGQGIDDHMKQISKLNSIYGRIWIVVDNNKSQDVVTKDDEKKANIRTYSYFVTPENMLNMSYDSEDNLNWALVHEAGRDDEDPLESSGDKTHAFRLWEKDTWTLYRLVPNGKRTPMKNSKALIQTIVKAFENKTESAASFVDNATEKTRGVLDLAGYDIEQDGPYTHGLGVVPIIPADNVISSEPYSSASLIDDVAYLDRAVANYLSNIDVVIQDQTFSQLVMPAQGLMPGEDGHDKILEMGTKRIFTYDAEGGAMPAYISPDAGQAEIILKVINKIINEIYHSVGLAGERTKEDNALGIDNSSGVAKAYDFERVNSLLASKADSLELIENKLVHLVKLWNGIAVKEDEPKLVGYPDNFDVRGLYDEFEIATKLAEITAPDTVRREQMEQLIDKLFPKIGKAIKEKMLADLKTWPPKLEITDSDSADSKVDDELPDNSGKPKSVAS